VTASRTGFLHRGLYGDPDLATDVADRHAASDLLQHRGDLLDGKARLVPNKKSVLAATVDVAGDDG
jgi:hypothetical protein